MDTQSALNNVLKKLNFIYLVLGLSYDSANATRKAKLKQHFIYVLNFFWLNSDVLGAIWWFVNGALNGKSFVQLTYVAPCVTFSLFANIRAYTLIHYEAYVSELINSLRSLEEVENARKRTMERDEIIVKDVKFLNAVINISNILNFGLIATFFMSPLILIVVKYLKTNQWDLLLPFLIIYPFDSHDIRYWPFVYLHQLWSESIVVLNICSTDYLLYICCVFIRIQFRLLQYDFTRIVGKASVDFDNEAFTRELVKLVKWHQELIRLSAILDTVYAKSTLFNFVASSILLCLTGFNVMAMEDKTLACTFLVFLSASLLQIFFVCFFGDLLMKSSTDVSYAIYESKWYLANSSAENNLHIVQIRAQKPCKLTAFGFADVNLRSFMSILSTAWSYFALLKTLYNPNKA
ncbi:putative odorant receptor 92a [Zerene cesonia]|uniref:putative odorant receptor 92a n=1 Tax=Zerene cesonia TaxID=33412 RepID=UPI0018E52A13|nr:putative odorant receptor 92a [Zerene cesonia]